MAKKGDISAATEAFYKALLRLDPLVAAVLTPRDMQLWVNHYNPSVGSPLPPPTTTELGNTQALAGHALRHLAAQYLQNGDILIGVHLLAMAQAKTPSSVAASGGLPPPPPRGAGWAVSRGYRPFIDEYLRIITNQ